MSLLTVEELTHSFGDKKVLNSINLRLNKGEHIALVGKNGAGKTTLFSLLMGDLTPDSGSITWHPGIRYGHLAQHSRLVPNRSIRDTLHDAFHDLYRVEADLQGALEALADAGEGSALYEREMKRVSRLQDTLDVAGFYTLPKRVEDMAAGLGLTALGLDTAVDRLSGGQRTKVLLAQLLLEAPDVLLLDEPTNYLDRQHIEWLTGYLSGYSNSYLIVSHDTRFLNGVCNVVYHLEFASLKRYSGNYDRFASLSEAEREQYAIRYERQQEEIAKLDDFVKRNIARASTTRRAQGRRKQLAKIVRMEPPQTAQNPVFRFKKGRDSSAIVLQSRALLVGYKSPLLPALNLKLLRGSKVAVTGKNGIGKSTLLKTFLGLIPPLSGNLQFGENIVSAYFAQEAQMTGRETVLQEVWREFPSMSQKEIRQALGRCGLKPEMAQMRPSELSGGEQARVRLCKLMLRESNWLLLDEPINHLDQVAREALKQALLQYNGTVIVVCHDTAFFSDWATEVWDIEQLKANRR